MSVSGCDSGSVSGGVSVGMSNIGRGRDNDSEETSHHYTKH